jgi:hypothetical protein
MVTHHKRKVKSSRNIADAARGSGYAPSIASAYTQGRSAYGVAFPTRGLNARLPTIADAGTPPLPHFLEGGYTAVRTAGANGGYLINPIREFVIAGGGAMPQGSVLFRIGESGEWIILRRY